MGEVHEAREVTLRKLRPMAPPFHRHIAKSKLMGKPWQIGDRVVVYEISGTIPRGQVLVTEKTLIRFD